MVLHHVDEIGRRAAADAAGDEFQLRVLGGGFLVGGDVAVLDHLRQHAVARFFGAVQVALGRRSSGSARE